MAEGLKVAKNGIQKKLDGMLTRAKSFQGAAARIYPLYQKLQTQRFMTENASEGAPWESVSSRYAEKKISLFGRYPGGGRKTLIATSTLAGAVIGPGAPFEGTNQHIALFTKNSMQIKVNQSGVNAAGKPFVYPEYVARRRPFMTFSQPSLDLMNAELAKYILGE